MKLFIDTGSVAEVEEIAAWGVLSGATTNPTLLAKEDGDPGDSIRRICELVDGPVSAEVVSDDARSMVAEGRALAGLDDRVVVKVPFSEEGLAATRELASDGIPVNETLVFSAAQALLIVEALGPNRDAQVLAASMRHPMHVVIAAKLGCEVATIPAKVLKAMLAHPLTESGVARFADDWKSRPEFGEWLRGLVEESTAAQR